MVRRHGSDTVRIVADAERGKAGPVKAALSVIKNIPSEMFRDDLFLQIFRMPLVDTAIHGIAFARPNKGLLRIVIKLNKLVARPPYFSKRKVRRFFRVNNKVKKETE